MTSPNDQGWCKNTLPSSGICTVPTPSLCEWTATTTSYYLLPVSKVHQGTASCLVGDASHPQDQDSLVLAFVCPIAVPCVLIDPKALFLTNWHFIVHPWSGYDSYHFTSAANRFLKYPRHGPNQTYIPTQHMYVHTRRR